MRDLDFPLRPRQDSSSCCQSIVQQIKKNVCSTWSSFFSQSIVLLVFWSCWLCPMTMHLLKSLKAVILGACPIELCLATENESHCSHKLKMGHFPNWRLLKYTKTLVLDASPKKPHWSPPGETGKASNLQCLHFCRGSVPTLLWLWNMRKVQPAIAEVKKREIPVTQSIVVWGAHAHSLLHAFSHSLLYSLFLSFFLLYDLIGPFASLLISQFIRQYWRNVSCSVMHLRGNLGLSIFLILCQSLPLYVFLSSPNLVLWPYYCNAHIACLLCPGLSSVWNTSSLFLLDEGQCFFKYPQFRSELVKAICRFW